MAIQPLRGRSERSPWPVQPPRAPTSKGFPCSQGQARGGALNRRSRHRRRHCLPCPAPPVQNHGPAVNRTQGAVNLPCSVRAPQAVLGCKGDPQILASILGNSGSETLPAPKGRKAPAKGNPASQQWLCWESGASADTPEKASPVNLGLLTCIPSWQPRGEISSAVPLLLASLMAPTTRRQKNAPLGHWQV